jgi:Sulfotransferase domain
MSGIYWLASYPKSGNTWLRALLTNYRRDSDEPATLDELEGSGAFLRETFDDCAGIESANLTQQQIEHYRPGVYERLAAESTEPLFLKIHDAYTYNADSRPIISKRATAGVIYLIRNPLDVAVSYAYHRNEAIDKTIRVMSRPDAMLAGSDRPNDHLPQRVLSWSGHICSWVDEADLNVHIVRYEDMVRQSVAVFTAIVRFAGLDVDADRVRKAVAFSCFEQLQAQEAAHGFAEKQPTAASFFRQGRAGSWRDELTDGQVGQLVTDHRSVMRRFGYLSASDQILC